MSSHSRFGRSVCRLSLAKCCPISQRQPGQNGAQGKTLASGPVSQMFPLLIIMFFPSRSKCICCSLRQDLQMLWGGCWLDYACGL